MLYEDEGDNYNYEKGYYATITFSWNDKARTLTIGTRQGGYEGMILDRTFNVVLPDGSSRQVEYNGNEMSVKL
jgi:alpha-D-xyloside xylohydrolase